MRARPSTHERFKYVRSKCNINLSVWGHFRIIRAKPLYCLISPTKHILSMKTSAWRMFSELSTCDVDKSFLFFWENSVPHPRNVDRLAQSETRRWRSLAGLILEESHTVRVYSYNVKNERRSLPFVTLHKPFGAECRPEHKLWILSLLKHFIDFASFGLRIPDDMNLSSWCIPETPLLEKEIRCADSQIFPQPTVYFRRCTVQQKNVAQKWRQSIATDTLFLAPGKLSGFRIFLLLSWANQGNTG